MALQDQNSKWSEFESLPHPSALNQAVVIEPGTLYNFDGTCQALALSGTTTGWKTINLGIDFSDLIRPGYGSFCDVVGTQDGIIVMGQHPLKSTVVFKKKEGSEEFDRISTLALP